MNLFLFIGICFVLYILFRNLNFRPNQIEGMTTSTEVSSLNGVAGNAATYGATIKATTIALQDTFLISKYSSDYENIILNLDDLMNNLMLQTTLSIDVNKPDEAVKKLAELNQAKVALNVVMKFIDSSK